MRRRFFIPALALSPVVVVLPAWGRAPRPRHKIGAAALHEALSARFPVRLGLRGLLELELTAPRLHLLPARNQLGAGLVAQVGGARAANVPPAEADVVFSLRYEASDRTLRALRPEFLDVRWPQASAENLRAVQALLSSLSRDLGEIVLHRFTQRELALADTMGFEPEEIRVVEDGLVIFFGPKAPRQ